VAIGDKIMPMKRQRGLRARLDRVESNAHKTMNLAQAAIYAVKEAMLGFIENLEDGVDVKIQRDPKVSLMDFVSGKVTELPFHIKIKFKDD
jgi:hypothetical protein